MKNFITKFKSQCNTLTGKALILSSTGIGVLSTSTIAHAAGDADVSAVTSQITTSLTASKADFATSLAAVVGVAIGFFILKFVVKQVIGYFAKVASKG